MRTRPGPRSLGSQDEADPVAAPGARTTHARGLPSGPREIPERAHPGSGAGRRRRASGRYREKAPDAVDLRLLPAALTVWPAAWAALGAGPAARPWCLAGASAAGLASAVLVPALVRYRPPRHLADGRPGSDGVRGSAPATVFLCLIALSACLVVSAAALHVREHDPLNAAVEQGSSVTLIGTVTAAPRPLAGSRGEARWLVSLDVTSVDGAASRAGVVVLGGQAWQGVDLGDVVRVHARLRPTGPGEREAALIGSAPLPRVLARADGVLGAVAGLRQGLVDAVGGEPLDAEVGVGTGAAAGTEAGAAAGTRAGMGASADAEAATGARCWAWPAGSHALVPGVALGDDASLPAAIREDMRTVSMTHLTAVSGQHVAIVLGLVLGGLGAIPRWWRAVAGAVVLALLVLLVRPGGSVLRAAVMGSVMLTGVAAGRRSASLPALCSAIVLLVLLDPWQARDYGFALSVSATGGILLGARPLQTALSAWIPRWLAGALAIPLVAQAACLPVLILLQPRWSPWAVVANVVAAPVVPVATVGGMLAALVAPWWSAAARMVAWPALASCAWLAAVARFFAHLPGASLAWPSGPGGAVLMALAETTVVVAVRWWMRRRRAP